MVRVPTARIVPGVSLRVARVAPIRDMDRPQVLRADPIDLVVHPLAASVPTVPAVHLRAVAQIAQGVPTRVHLLQTQAGPIHPGRQEAQIVLQVVQGGLTRHRAGLLREAACGLLEEAVHLEDVQLEGVRLQVDLEVEAAAKWHLYSSVA